jgi:ribosomal-protein-alanine N-acetyltransferase
VKLLETSRLRLRRFTEADAPFLLALMNEPSYHQNIGDRGVRDLEGCLKYMRERILQYDDRGLGVFLIEHRETGEALGFSSLIKRDQLTMVDIGYAFPPAHWGKGYAIEASQGVMEYARDRLRLKELCGVVDPRNMPSARVLQKLGMSLMGRVRLSAEDIELDLYTRAL